jgi:hypoxanthine phosphoribosyltransferase
MKSVTRTRYIYGATLFVIFSLFVLSGYVYSLLQSIETEIRKRPSWIDPSLDKVMQKKQNVSIFLKILHILFGIFVPFCDNGTQLFCSWRDLEYHLDDIVKLLSEKGIKVDHVVGIKSGGAIITKYVAEKLNVGYSYIKVSNKDYNCKKKETDFIKEGPKRWFGAKREYMVCEPIDEDLKGKNVLILDEQVMSGVTMKAVIDYVNKEKGAKQVYPVVISNYRKRKYDYDLLYTSTIRYAVWPWGYDN